MQLESSTSSPRRLLRVRPLLAGRVGRERPEAAVRTPGLARGSLGHLGENLKAAGRSRENWSAGLQDYCKSLGKRAVATLGSQRLLMPSLLFAVWGLVTLKTPVSKRRMGEC